MKAKLEFDDWLHKVHREATIWRGHFGAEGNQDAERHCNALIHALYVAIKCGGRE